MTSHIRTARLPAGLRAWLFDRMVLWLLGGATGMTTWVEDKCGDEGVIRVKVERDWKREAPALEGTDAPA